MTKLKQERRDKREELFNNIVNAFGEKYSWLGAQAAREMLLSAASWNIEKYSDPPMRFRNHVMLSWDRGWVKSTMMRKMATVLGDELCSDIGKVTDAAMRGSVSAGKFMPPKPLKTPFIISTEFGQTDFDEELLNVFLNMLEEGRTNVALNKIGSLPEKQKASIENNFDGDIEFRGENEFTVKCDFVFWGATYDPRYIQDDALRSRFRFVTPAKPLTSEVTKAMDKAPPVLALLDQDDCVQVRREIMSDKEVKTGFTPPDHLYDEYSINPRESRDLQSYMAALNWWGLDVNPEVMENFLQNLKRSRRISSQTPEERVFDLIFDNPMTYEDLQEETGYHKKELYRILEKLDADKGIKENGDQGWVVYSGEDNMDYMQDDEENAGIDSIVEEKKKEDVKAQEKESGFLED